MLRVSLTQGQEALVDDEDGPLVLAHKWHAQHDHRGQGSWQAVRRVYERGHCRRERMTHVILTVPAGATVEHRNGDGLDNRRANLIVVPRRTHCPCGGPLVPGASRCKTCLARAQRDIRERRLAQGLCGRCGQVPPPMGKSLCVSCDQALKQRVEERRKRLGPTLKAKAVAYLGGHCLDCGLVTPYLAAYDFHHRDGTQKEQGIARMISCVRPWTRIRPELDKCDLLCATCHRIRHAREEDNSATCHDVPVQHG